jgi:hypothetical protein
MAAGGDGAAAPPEDGSGPPHGLRALDRLVGRERELAMVREALAAAAPSSIGVVGPPGVGKTVLAAAARELAQAAGWNALPREGTFELLADQSGRDLLLQLAGAIESEGADAGLVTPSCEADTPPAPARGPGPVIGSLFGGAAQEWTRRPLTTPGLVGALEGLTPLLVTLNVPRPSRELLAWVHDEAMPVVRTAGLAVVLLLSCEPWTDGVDVAPFLDRVATMGPPDGAAVRERLDRAAGGGLPAEELDGYVAAVQDDPQLLESFLRLLPLTRPFPSRGGSRG